MNRKFGRKGSIPIKEPTGNTYDLTFHELVELVDHTLSGLRGVNDYEFEPDASMKIAKGVFGSRPVTSQDLMRGILDRVTRYRLPVGSA